MAPPQCGALNKMQPNPTAGGAAVASVVRMDHGAYAAVVETEFV